MMLMETVMNLFIMFHLGTDYVCVGDFVEKIAEYLQLDWSKWYTNNKSLAFVGTVSV